MNSRRVARERAAQILYQLDLNPSEPAALDRVFAEFWAGQLSLVLAERVGNGPDASRDTSAWRSLVASYGENPDLRSLIDQDIVEKVRAAILKYESALAAEEERRAAANLSPRPATKWKEQDWRDLVADRASREFTEALVRGVRGAIRDIDAILREHAENWDMRRIGNVERNVLRMAIYEMLFAEPRLPAPIAINEAVDVCKFFGTSESGRFANGVLDGIARDGNLHDPSR